MIDSYDFGKVVVDGNSYKSDVIIFPEKVNSSWWRKEGHSLCMEDVKDIVDYHPDALVIGQGKPGLMKVPDAVRKAIVGQGIEVFVSGTEKAARKYNEISPKKKTVAALHLTC